MLGSRQGLFWKNSWAGSGLGEGRRWEQVGCLKRRGQDTQVLFCFGLGQACSWGSLSMLTLYSTVGFFSFSNAVQYINVLEQFLQYTEPTT